MEIGNVGHRMPREPGKSKLWKREVHSPETATLHSATSSHAIIHGLSIESLITMRLQALNDIPITTFVDRFYDHIVQPVDKAVISYILGRVQHNQVHAAQILGLNRNTLRKRMAVHGLFQHKEITNDQGTST